MFKRWFNKAANSFDDVRQMTTRKLPVPDLEGTEKFVQLKARRTKEGYWTISIQNNIKTVTAGVQEVSRAYRSAITKHTGRYVSGNGDEEFRMNFDAAFLILRDMEESLLKYRDTPPGPEPDHHFMAAYRLLPAAFRTQMDDIFFERTAEKGEVLPPKKPQAQPAAKPDTPKNGGFTPN